MINFYDTNEQDETEIVGVDFAYYDATYRMTEDGNIYRLFGTSDSPVFRQSKISIIEGAPKFIMISGSHRKIVSMPKLVKLLLHGEERDRKWIVEHKDGDKMNCHPDNLEWAKFKGRNHGVK